jgi:hypothetical protein
VRPPALFLSAVNRDPISAKGCRVLSKAIYSSLKEKGIGSVRLRGSMEESSKNIWAV